jgi:hypothetical protein
MSSLYPVVLTLTTTEVIDIPERIKSDNQRRALGLKVLNTLCRHN